MQSTRSGRRTRRVGALLSTALASLLVLGVSVPAFAQAPPPSPPGPPPAPPVPTFQGRGDGEAAPAPGSLGTDVPLIYNGAAPSTVQKELIGPYQLLRAGQLDVEASTITLPLYLGKLSGGRNVWYILTDTSDERNAEALGLNFAAKLNYSVVGRSARVATMEKDGTVVFESGTVDFRPARRIVPGDAPNFFPPKAADPGSVGDANYTPLVRIVNAGNHVYNAPMVAFDVNADQLNFCDGNPDYSRVHDRVAKICPQRGTVTIKLTPIFSFARPSLYMSTEASDPMVAALDAGTLAPAMSELGVGRDDGAFSAIERLFVIANGPTGKDNPQRQGLNSAVGDGPMANGGDRPPLNVIGGIPTISLDYSPLWDLNLGEWTQDAINRGYRARVNEEFQILGLVQQGWITGPGGRRFGSTGIVVNCPIVHRFL
ncbi:MAG: hypothetical protein M3442_01930 [Chloroflexota bacterium]|nr:hypothetical protein [Chloroflexota bacterium]